MCWVYRKVRDGNNWLYVVGYYVVIVDAESTIRCNWESVEDFNGDPQGERLARGLVNFLNGGSVGGP